MTRFYRRGFYRHSVLGTIHRVEGHWVQRGSWDRYGDTSDSSVPVLYRTADRATARYVSPNAKCPVCGASVFFYQNSFGSRVYFDELGPPWPKHPCTDDSEAKARSTPVRREQIEPALRSETEERLISSYLKEAGVDLGAQFVRSHGHAPWKLYRISGRFRGRGVTLLVLSEPFGGGDKLRYISAQKVPATVQSGLFVYVRRGRLSFFDLTTMEPRKIEVAPLGTASDFARALIGSDE